MGLFSNIKDRLQQQQQQQQPGATGAAAVPTAPQYTPVTRDQAWSQFQDVYKGFGRGDLLEGDYAGEAQREFGDWFKNASDSGELQGIDGQGTGKTWADLMPELQQRVGNRVNDGPDSQGGGNGGSSNGGYQPPNEITASWNAGSAAQLPTKQTDPRRSELFDILMKRVNQDIRPDRNDPVIRAQSDANIANEERVRRNYVSDAAERGGPLANIQGERRMAAERAGQRTGQFEAALMGQELAARRQEVAQSLKDAQGFLSDEEHMELSRELANLDALIKQQGMSLQDKGLNQDWQKALLNNDQFLRQLGLNEWDRTNYWDALRSGFLG